MTKTPNTIDYVEFPAPDAGKVAEAKTFYARVFGWSFNDWGESYIDTASSGVPSGLNADPDHRPAKPLAVIYASDLAASREGILAAGGGSPARSSPSPVGSGSTSLTPPGTNSRSGPISDALSPSN